jgi:chorismate mutase
MKTDLAEPVLGDNVSGPTLLIAEQRKRIDEIDTQIAELICDRYARVLTVGAIKKAHCLKVHDASREALQMANLSKIATLHKVPHNILIFTFKMLIAMSRASQGEKSCERLVMRHCKACDWGTYGLDDPEGSNYRVCPRCQMPLL